MREAEITRILREVGRRIRAHRLQAGLTQEEAGAAAGIDYKRWQRLEQGEVNPTVKTLARAARAVGLSVWELLAPPDSRSGRRGIARGGR